MMLENSNPRFELSLADIVLTMGELARMEREEEWFSLARFIGHDPFPEDGETEKQWEDGTWTTTEEFAAWRNSVVSRAGEVRTFFEQLAGTALSRFRFPPEGSGEATG